ncbi:NTPase KAP [Pseudodesulfovibrio sp. F-1]|uniref:NTPase KAP n=1 Tax=Pseudodesulfovibrio alkaliphilus TaxID=2661613 RepID=A0A7K1KMT1_9BACT|nr:P-loop NTPase fold protein [Pseudodesulfovibrio alkaliphilus]MUM77393.1 NTPase KAP [Pseudodesulfovibrio alkaliphilus]
MSIDHNDNPISEPEQDVYGIASFASGIAQGISKMKAPAGFTIAINGPWGAGKSSAINLVRHYLDHHESDTRFEIVNFKCWWFKGEEALTLAFLQELNTALVKTIGGKDKSLIPDIAKLLLQARPVVGTAINMATGTSLGTLISGAMKFSERFFQNESLEKLFKRLEGVLQIQDKHFLFIIDDIDRLTPDEALIVFMLIKSVGRLPNVIYLVAFDRDVCEKAIANRFPSEGPKFLEKIIQSSFELPLPAPSDLNEAMYSSIQSLCGPLEFDDERHFMNLFHDGIAPFLFIPRDIVRISNAMTVSYPPIKGEVDIASFVSMEGIRLYEPALYSAIRRNKDRVCGVNRQGQESKATLDELLSCVDEKDRNRAERMLTRLFPRLGNIGYSGDFLKQWDAMRLVCVEKHFDTYFRMAVSDDVMPAIELSMFISKCGDEEFVRRALLEASNTIRRNGSTRVPLILNAIGTHSSKVADGDVPALVKAIFEIGDDIDREEDRGREFGSINTNHLEIMWLIQDVVVRRRPIEERSEIFLQACAKAQVGWLCYFVAFAVADHFPREGKSPVPEEACLVHNDDIESFKRIALGRISEAANEGILLEHPRLPGILFRWSEFSPQDDNSLRTWTSDQLNDNTAVASLAKAFTTQVRSYSSGDSVSVRRRQASTDGLEKLLDVRLFRSRLEECRYDKSLTEKQRNSIETFLTSWEKKESGDIFS